MRLEQVLEPIPDIEHVRVPEAQVQRVALALDLGHGPFEGRLASGASSSALAAGPSAAASAGTRSGWCSRNQRMELLGELRPALRQVREGGLRLRQVAMAHEQGDDLVPARRLPRDRGLATDDLAEVLGRERDVVRVAVRTDHVLGGHSLRCRRGPQPCLPVRTRPDPEQPAERIERELANIRVRRFERGSERCLDLRRGPCLAKRPHGCRIADASASRGHTQCRCQLVR